MRRHALRLYARLCAVQEALRLERDNAGDVYRLQGEVNALTRAVDALTHRVNTECRDSHARYQYLDAAMGARFERHVREWHLQENPAETAKEAS